ncbi:hypothetical protein LXL04_000925 [Taraxacum kok-saghyz]
MFKAPKGVIKELESIRRRFFLGENEEGKSIPWIKWEEVQKNKKDGGLGIGSLEKLNLALIAKWVWRYRTEPDAMWVKVIDNIHGPDSLCTTDDLKICHSNWKKIMKSMYNQDQVDLDMRKITRRKCEDGKTTKFWEESWLSDKPLREVYPRLYSLELDKYCVVADRCFLNNSFRWNWRTDIRNGRTGGELQDLEDKIRHIRFVEKNIFGICGTRPFQRRIPKSYSLQIQHNLSREFKKLKC